MQKLSICIWAENTQPDTQVQKEEFTLSLNLHDKTGLSKVVGTSLNRIFQFNDMLRETSKHFVKATNQLFLKIEFNGLLIDTSTLNQKYTEKLKFGKTAESKKRFANRFYLVVQFLTTDVKVVKIEELLKGL